jgi:hypothetical protein
MANAIDARVGLNTTTSGPIEILTERDAYHTYPSLVQYKKDLICIHLGSNTVIWFDEEYARKLCGCLAKIDDLICTLKLAEGGKDGD